MAQLGCAPSSRSRPTGHNRRSNLATPGVALRSGRPSLPGALLLFEPVTTVTKATTHWTCRAQRMATNGDPVLSDSSSDPLVTPSGAILQGLVGGARRRRDMSSGASLNVSGGSYLPLTLGV